MEIIPQTTPLEPIFVMTYRIMRSEREKKKNSKIPNGQPEAINRRTDNTMIKGQTASLHLNST